MDGYPIQNPAAFLLSSQIWIWLELWMDVLHWIGYCHIHLCCSCEREGQLVVIISCISDQQWHGTTQAPDGETVVSLFDFETLSLLTCI